MTIMDIPLNLEPFKHVLLMRIWSNFQSRQSDTSASGIALAPTGQSQSFV